MLSKNIREITEGAILLGIYGAILILNKYVFATFFSALCYVVVADIMIIFMTKYPKSKRIYSLIFGAFVLNFLSGDIYIMVYGPLGIVLGLVYYFGLKKQLDKRQVIAISILSACIYEILAFFTFLPLFNISLSKTIALTQEMVLNYSKSFDTNLMSILNTPIFLIGLIILEKTFNGIVEALLVNLSTTVIFNGLRLKLNLVKKTIISYQPNTYVAYISLIGFWLGFYLMNQNTINLSQIFGACLCVLSTMILLWYGYIAFKVLDIVLKRKFSTLALLLLVLVFYFFIFIYVIIGFLYGAGPLRDWCLKRLAYEKN